MSQSNQPAKDANPAPTAALEPDSTSARVREEIKSTVIPQVQAQGKDPSSKDVYPTIINDLAKKYNVTYNAVKKQWDKVLSEGGTKPPQLQPQTTTRTVGGVTMEVKAEPKPPRADKQTNCPKCGAPLTPDHQCTQTAPQEIVEIDGKKYNKVKLANGQTVLQEVQEKQEKPPPTPEELERSKQFTARSLRWVREKTEVEVEPTDEEFLADLAKNILEELRWKIPTAFKAIVFFLAVIFLYIVPGAQKLRAKLSAKREAKSEEKAP